MYCPACGSDYPPDWKVCPKDTTQLLRSRTIGKYAIEGLLGVGGMGAVYRASNPDTKARVAIKVMNPVVAGADSARARFQREAASVAALRTSHVVKVFDFGNEPDGTLFLVMELLDGHTLREEITPGPEYMPLARVQMVLDGALKGLAAAHKVGIVHRDLKPENVFVADTDDGEVPKLLDFGIARVRTRDSDLTRTGSLMGTASYMAPEQVAANAGEIGPWSDVYGMGVILYEMLAGAPAFGGTTVTEVLQKVLRNEAVPLASVRPGLPQSVYTLVERCTNVDPKKRPQDAEMMRNALSVARIAEPGSHVPPASHKTKQSQSVAMAGTAAAGLGGAATYSPAHGNAAPEAAGDRVATTPSVPPPTTGARGEQLEAHKKRSAWPWVVLALVVAGGGGFAVYQMVNGGGSGSGSGSGSVAVVDPPPRTHDAGAVVPSPAIDARVDVVQTPPGGSIDAAVEQKDPHADMVLIEEGTYDIGGGKAQEHPLSRGRVPLKAYWIDRHEMTRAELQAIDKLPADARTAAKDDPPATPARYVTWTEAKAACEALGKRLPTEAEWEVAARKTPQDPKKARLYKKGGNADLYAPSKDCNAAAPCDMLGSLAEWVDDGPSSDATKKIIRGASYQLKATDVRASIDRRTLFGANERDDEVGFRCAMAATKGAP